MADQSDAEDCLAYPEFLTRWEIDFLESITDWEGDLTERQEEVLENIMDKIDTALQT